MNYRRDLYYLSEGIHLLCHLGSGKSYKQKIDKKLEEASTDAKAFCSRRKNQIDLYETIENAAKRKLKGDWDQLLYYFGPIDNGDNWDCIGRILLLWDEFNHPNVYSPDEYENLLFDLSEEEYTSSFAQCIQGLGDTARFSTDYESVDNASSLLDFILKLEFSNEICLKIEDAYINYPKHIAACFKLIRKCVAVIEKYEDKLLPLVDDLVDYIGDMVGECDPIEFFRSKFSSLSTLPDCDLGYTISPEIFAPFEKGFSLEMDSDTGKLTKPYFLPIGVLYCEECPLDYDNKKASHSHSEEFYLEAIKQLADGNRFKLLSYIKDTPRFGHEIANHLELTTATVSHHTNMLSKSYLILTEQKGARLYYSSNKENIKGCLDFLRSELL